MLLSPQNSPWQLDIAEGFAKANSVVIIITSVKILLRWSFPSKIYIQFTIFNTYFSTKLSFTNKRYHLHVLEKCLYMLWEVRSIMYFRQFIYSLSLRSRGSGTSFAFTSYIMVSAKFCEVKFLNDFYFVSFFYHLFIYQHQTKIRLMTLELVYTIFYQVFIFHQMIALQKLWKMFISSKKLFSFSRYSNFCISVFPYFSP